jgi:hypothetical protein
LKGSSSLYQDPECVVMLSSEDNVLTVDVVKNKGKMTKSEFGFVLETGKITDRPEDPINKDFDDF